MRELPQGITLGNKVLLVPAITSAFWRSSHVEEISREGGYHWVNRGDPIAKYVLSAPRSNMPRIGSAFGNADHEAIIPAPASGLLLGRKYSFIRNEETDAADFADYGTPSFRPPYRVSLLLPDDEPPAMESSQVFSEFAECVQRNRGPFLKQYQDQAALSEAALEALLRKQLARRVYTVEAMPHFNDYFEEARKMYPELRPHLKHLLP